MHAVAITWRKQFFPLKMDIYDFSNRRKICPTDICFDICKLKYVYCLKCHKLVKIPTVFKKKLRLFLCLVCWFDFCLIDFDGCDTVWKFIAYGFINCNKVRREKLPGRTESMTQSKFDLTRFNRREHSRWRNYTEWKKCFFFGLLKPAKYFHTVMSIYEPRIPNVSMWIKFVDCLLVWCSRIDVSIETQRTENALRWITFIEYWKQSYT